MRMECDRAWLEHVGAIDLEQVGLAQPGTTPVLRTESPSELRPPGETTSSSEDGGFNSESEVSSDSDPEIPRPPMTRRTKGDLPVHLRHRRSRQEKAKQPKDARTHEERKPQDLPKRFTKFKKGDRVVILLGAKRQGQTSEPISQGQGGESGSGRGNPRPVFIADDFTEEEETCLVALL